MATALTETTLLPTGAANPVNGAPAGMHVVIVDEEFPYPANSGKRIRSLNLTLPLARRHRITYVAHPSADPTETAEAVAFLRSNGIETVTVERSLPAKSGCAFYGRLLANLASPLPYSVQVHQSAALRSALRQYAASHAVDLWHCEWTPYAQSLMGTVAGPWVAVAHNVESLIWQRYYETEQNRFKRWYIGHQWRKFQRFERRAFAATSTLIAVSEPDAALARSQFGAPRVTVVENGVDTSYFQPDATVRQTNEILYLGSLDWRPNLDAVERLLDRVFPEVRAQVPNARLVIAGRKPPAWLADRVRASEGVALMADLPDVRPLLRRCGVMAVPLRIGGGSRLKILEALAAQCPVISTRVGAEGLELKPDQDFVEVSTVDQMAGALVQAILEPGPIRDMARHGRGVVMERYDWPILAEKLEAVWLKQRKSCPSAPDLKS